MGAYLEVLANYEQAIGLFRAVGDRLGEANTLLSLGKLETEPEEALEFYRRAQQLYRHIGNQYSQARNLTWFIAQAQVSLDDLTSAIASLQEAADIFEAIGLEDLRDTALKKLKHCRQTHHPKSWAGERARPPSASSPR